MDSRVLEYRVWLIREKGKAEHDLIYHSETEEQRQFNKGRLAYAEKQLQTFEKYFDLGLPEEWTQSN